MDNLLVYSADALVLTVPYHPHFDSVKYPRFFAYLWTVEPLRSFFYTVVVSLPTPSDLFPLARVY